MGKTNFIVRGGMDLSKIQQGFKKTQTEIVKFKQTSKRDLQSTQSAFNGFKNGITKAVKGIALVLGTLAIGKYVKDSVSLAMSYESSFNQISRTMGRNASEFNLWANTQAKGFGMARVEATKYGAVYSNLISGFAKDSAETTKYTTDLLKASAVVASATGRTMEDTMERIRSGLLGNTESIEDLGINVNIAMIESTKAFKRFAGDRSWKQLTFQEQQQIRLMAILEQANEKYGDTLANTSATGMMKFLATLKDIKLNIGNTFKPIADVIIPSLDAMAQRLERVTALMADFMGELFGKNKKGTQETKKQADAYNAVAESITNASNAAKKAQTGFDELNIVQTKDDSEDETGISSSNVFATNAEVGAGTEVSPDVKNAVSKFKAHFKGLGSDLKKIFMGYIKQISPSIISWSSAFDSMKEPARKAMDTIKEKMSGMTGVMSNYMAFFIYDYIPSIKNGFANTFAPIFAETMPVLFKTFGDDTVFALDGIKRYIETILVPSMQFMQTVFAEAFSSIKLSWDTYGDSILDKFITFKENIRELWTDIYDKIIGPVFGKIGQAATGLWNDHLKGLWSNITDFVGSFTEMILALWNNVLSPVVKWFVDKFGEPIKQSIGTVIDIIKTVIGTVSDVIGGSIKSISGFMEFLAGVFTGNWKKAWNGIKKSFEGVWDGMYGLFKGIVNLIIDGINLLWEGVYQAVRGIVDGIGSVAGALGKLLGKDWKFSMPEKAPIIPKLATGGIVDRSTLVNVGEAGKEAIIPLERNTEWIDALAERLNGMGGGQLINKIYLDGKLIKEQVVDLINQETILSGRSPLLGV